MSRKAQSSGNLIRFEKASFRLSAESYFTGDSWLRLWDLGTEDKSAETCMRTWHANLKQTERVTATRLAIVSMGLGNHQEAIAWLESAYAEGALWSLGFRSDPILKPLAGDHRLFGSSNKIGGAMPLLRRDGVPGARGTFFPESALIGEISESHRQRDPCRDSMSN